MTDEVWVERYRPDTLDEIVGHTTVVQRMRDFVDDPEMPNLLFAGKQGIGKTAIVQAFAKEKYGDDWGRKLMELNASDDRGINVVRDQIKDFARQGAGQHDFKVIFLDEADQLTDDAQPALRRTMEDYSDTTRFILSCNYPNQIIDPLLSRCGVYRLTPLSDGEVEVVLERVVDGEGLDVEEGALDEVVSVARGDARTAINTLQAATLDGELTVADAQELLGLLDRDVVESIVDDALEGEFDDAMNAVDEKVLKSGASTNAIMELFLNDIRYRKDINEDTRMKAMDAIGRADWRVRQGANPHVQIHAMLSSLPLAKFSSTGGYNE